LIGTGREAKVMLLHRLALSQKYNGRDENLRRKSE
jgi:hypothetical protein